jgi:replicative DNA helicase|tara:strand:+ start:2582 stop:3982 length:1401 start_codon:yes stop_codon:yes gene_type:complete
MEDRIKIYPHSEDSEEAVLGCIIQGGGSVFEKANAWIREEEAFYYDKNKVLWNIIHKMHRDGEDIDMITVADKVKNKNKMDETTGLTLYYITGLPESIPTIANVETYSKIIWEKYIKREAIKSSYKLYNSSFEKQDESVEALLYHHSKLINELLEIAPSRKKEISATINETVETLRTGKNIIKFGYPQLDNIAGGMTRKELTVIGGRPGHGKTTLTLNIVTSLLKQGYRVMLFNREMSNVEVIKKFMIMKSRDLNYRHLRTGNIDEGRMQIIELLVDELKDQLQNLIMYDDIRNLDDAMREIQREKPDVVVDDYIQLIKVDNRQHKDRRFEIEDILTEYKWVCKKEDCAAILVSQLNREIEKRIEPRPRLADFAESGTIEQTAETALLLFYGYNFNDDKYDGYEIEIICDKARYGKIGTYVMGFSGNKCKFYAKPDDARKEMRDDKNRNKVKIDSDRILSDVQEAF